YLFFWQASQEVEEERAQGRGPTKRKGATEQELKHCRTDVLTGMFFSNFVMYFIILSTAATLHAHGQTQISTARHPPQPLMPLAGAGAYWLFALGLIGAGMLGIPVLAGSCAYAITEALKWRGSLQRKPRNAKKFYGVMAVAMIIGLCLNYLGKNAVAMLFFAA